MKTNKLISTLFPLSLLILALLYIGTSCGGEPPCDEQTWYQDTDGDGFGNPDVSLFDCNQPNGYVTDNTDCDDNNETIHPGADELCDGFDNNCNGVIDESPTDCTAGSICVAGVCVTQQTDNGFTYEETFYPTPNCYIEFDEDGSPYEFNLFFTNGLMLDNANHYEGNTNDYLFSMNLSTWVFYNIREEQNPSIINPTYPNIETGVQYVGGASDSTILFNGSITAFDTPLIVNGTEFGYGNENDPNTVINTPGATGPFITLDSYSFDINTQTGTIDCNYTFLNQDGITITGHYNGDIEIILD